MTYTYTTIKPNSFVSLDKRSIFLGSSRISVKKWLGSLWIRRNDNRYVRKITVNPNCYNHTESQANKVLIFE
jgi:hypothetical protein